MGVKYYEQRFLSYFCKPSARQTKDIRSPPSTKTASKPAQPASQPKPAYPDIKTTTPPTPAPDASPPEPWVPIQEAVVHGVQTVQDDLKLEEHTTLETPTVDIAKLDYGVLEAEQVEETPLEASPAEDTQEPSNVIDEVLQLEYITGSKDSASIPSIIDFPDATKDALKLNQVENQEPISPSTAVDEASCFHGSSGQSAEINNIAKSEEILCLKESINEQNDSLEHSSTLTPDQSETSCTNMDASPAKKPFGFFNCCAVSEKEPEITAAESVCA